MGGGGRGEGEGERKMNARLLQNATVLYCTMSLNWLCLCVVW